MRISLLIIVRSDGFIKVENYIQSKGSDPRMDIFVFTAPSGTPSYWRESKKREVC